MVANILINLPVLPFSLHKILSPELAQTCLALLVDADGMCASSIDDSNTRSLPVRFRPARSVDTALSKQGSACA